MNQIKIPTCKDLLCSNRNLAHEDFSFTSNDVSTKEAYYNTSNLYLFCKISLPLIFKRASLPSKRCPFAM